MSEGSQNNGHCKPLQTTDLSHGEFSFRFTGGDVRVAGQVVPLRKATVKDIEALQGQKRQCYIKVYYTDGTSLDTYYFFAKDLQIVGELVPELPAPSEPDKVSVIRQHKATL